MKHLRRWCVASAVLTVLVLPALAGPASAASYAWTLTCKIDGQAGASASWNWLQDGQVIAGAGGTAGCGGSGGGDRPANANGITASIVVRACAFGGACKENSKSVTKSFDPAGGFSVTIKASEHSTGKYCYLTGKSWRWHCTSTQSSISATFTMSG